MKIKKILSRISVLAACLVVAHVASADTATIPVPANSVVNNIEVRIPADAKLLRVRAAGGSVGKIELYLREGRDFNRSLSLIDQADFYSLNRSGEASISIGDYSTPALRGGSWFAALRNTSGSAATITFEGTSSTDNAPETEFVVHFDAPSSALESVFGGADKLECDVAPWSDATPMGASTLGAFRRKLVNDTAKKLASQVHSPVPVHIQACWKEFEDKGEKAGSYTLAAATGVYSFYDIPGAAMADTYYPQATTARLAGTRVCNIASSVDCSIPEIVVWYNKAEVAAKNYDDESDEPLIVAVTMHEIVHGLGFLSTVRITNPDECEETPVPAGVDCDQIGRLWNGRSDAYTSNVTYLDAPADKPFERTPLAFARLSQEQRKAALVSGQYLTWGDAVLGQSPLNILRYNPAPTDLVQLHAPSKIQAGSTLSHLGPVHVGQLMTAVIQRNYPDTLGLAEAMLENAGWNTSKAKLAPPGTIAVGPWYDVNHSGHGIDFEKVVSDPKGDQYAVIFYSYDKAGQAEYFYSGGRLLNGRYGDAGNSAQPALLGRPIYDPASRGASYPGPHGTLGIDFTAAAANHPACAGSTAEVKALLSWSMAGESGTWCIAPLINDAQRPAAAQDLNGLWSAGSGDSGWGFSVVESLQPSGPFLSPLLVYFYGTDNQPHWAQAEVVNYVPGQVVNLYHIKGYCRTCAKQATSPTPIGSMTLNLRAPEHAETPSGANRVSISIDGGGTLRFERNNTPVRTFSLPRGG